MSACWIYNSSEKKRNVHQAFGNNDVVLSDLSWVKTACHLPVVKNLMSRWYRPRVFTSQVTQDMRPPLYSLEPIAVAEHNSFAKNIQATPLTFARSSHRVWFRCYFLFCEPLIRVL